MIHCKNCVYGDYIECFVKKAERKDYYLYESQQTKKHGMCVCMSGYYPRKLRKECCGYKRIWWKLWALIPIKPIERGWEDDE